MAGKGFAETDELCRKIVGDAEKGIFSPIYLLMGEEPFYPDRACEAIVSHALTPEERDFNQTIFYGLDTDALAVSTEAQTYPVFAQRRLVVLKEAQSMRTLEGLAEYCEAPLDSTVLVILMHGASADKRRAFYKACSKNGVVLESNAVRDYEIDRWVMSYYRGRGLSIDPEAAALIGEFAGTDLSRIAIETDKMLKNLPEGTVNIGVKDVEANFGMSRQYSIFELTKELSARNASKALKISAYIGASPKFAMPMAVAAIYNHFYRILKYEALLGKTGGHPSPQEKASVLAVNPYFYREYDMAAKNYSMNKCLSIMGLLEEYDYKGKGGESGEATPEELLTELVARILNT